MARFVFVGELGLSEDFIRTNKEGAEFEFATFNASIIASNNNRAFIELFGGKSDVIKTKDIDGNDIEIDLDDRFDENIVDSVANYRKHIINLDGETRKEFIYDYDAVQYLADNASDIKGKKFKVTGTVNKNVYNGKITDRFAIQNIFLADEDDKNMFRIDDIFYWNKDSLDVADFSEDKKIYMNGYVQAYIDKKTLGTDNGANKYVPQQAILDCNKLDFENEKHMKLLDFKLMGIGLKRDPKTNKITNAIKGKTFYKQNIEFSYQNGAETIEWDESQLNDWQKTQVELGLKTADDFRPAGQSFGPKVTIYKIRTYNSRSGSEFEEGYVDTELTEDEFDEEVLIPQQNETVEEVVEKAEKKAKEVVEEDDSIDDLFD